MEPREFLLVLFIALFLCCFCCFCSCLLNQLLIYVWEPHHLRQQLQMQGLRGPPPKFLLGNMNDVMEMKNQAFQHPLQLGNHDLLPRICPYYSEWSKLYGETFVFWWGREPRITVTDPEMIKQILCTKAAHFGKSPLQKKGGAVLLGNGLIMANGKDWAYRRQIVCRAFKMDKIKRMVPAMVESMQELIRNWDHLLNLGVSGAEVDVYKDVGEVTADIIARTAFGSSYSDGLKLFHMLTSIQKLFVQSNKYLWLPGSRLLPTGANKKIHTLRRQMRASLQELVRSRREAKSSTDSYGNDLLGLMLAASENHHHQHSKRSMISNNNNSSGSRFSTEELIEECQTFFFVGHETTLMLVTWSLMLLALNPRWQTRAREEADRVFTDKVPDADMISQLKTVGMILNETLRLYPPAPNLVRAALRDTKVGHLQVPRGSTFWIPILGIHHDKSIWGDDAHEFNPERFSSPDEAPRRSSAMEFLPFSFGPRVCVGQSFAIMEAKLIVAMIVRHYELSISPSYQHSPVSSITLKPKHGMQLRIRHHRENSR